MKRVDYDGRLHGVYRQARALPAASLAAWCDAFDRYLPTRRPLTLVDVGSGTGRFTPLLAERFGGLVYGVEPSPKMREQASLHATHPRVDYLPGSAEDLPLGDGSCDGALLYFVWHHVADRDAAAAELWRVVRPGGVLLLRTQFSDRMPDLWWQRAYPPVKEVDASTYDTEAATVAPLTAAGWKYQGRVEVEYELAPNRRAHFERLRLAGLSVFERLSSAQRAEMFAAMEQTADDTTGPEIGVGDLLLFSRPGRSRVLDQGENSTLPHPAG